MKVETVVDVRLAELKAEHAKLDARLRELENHISLSPEEQTERVNLKKAKLVIKDGILHLSHRRL